MKKLILFFIALIFITKISFAAGVGTTLIGGEQGTGMIKFVSPKNDYSIDYHKSWSVYEIHSRHSFIDKENTTLDKVNSLVICKNQDLKIKNADELYSLIKKKYPEERFEPISIQDKRGFRNITTRNLGLIFILRGDSDLIVLKTKTTGDKKAKDMIDHMIKSLDISALRKGSNSEYDLKSCF